MLTEFHRIPEIFVTRYDAELMKWAEKFREWGPQCMVRLRGPIRGVPEFDDNGERPLVFAVLKAEISGSRVVVSPMAEKDEDLIRRHVEALRH
jgi:hypothetical protein